MNELKCQFANHQEKKIITICLDKDCQQKRLCCFRCVSQFHGGHDDKLIEVEQFIDFMKVLSKKQVQAPESYTHAQNQIIQGLEQLCKLITSFQKIVQERLQEIKGQNLQEYVKKFNNKQQGVDSINEFIENILEYVEVNNGALTKNKQFNSQLNQEENKQVSIIKESEYSLLKLIESFDTRQQLKSLRFNEDPIQLQGGGFKISQAIVSQDGSIIVSISENKMIKVWDIQSNQIQQKIQLETEKAYSMGLSSNNQYLAYYYIQLEDRVINLYDLKLNKQIVKSKDLTHVIESIVFSQDTQYLLTGGNDEKLIVWKTLEMKQIHQFQTYNYIKMITISPDNKYISYLTSLQGQIYIWDFQTKTKLIQQNNIHKFGHTLCSSADSQIYITSGSEGLIKIWKFSQLQDNKYSLTLTKEIQAGSMYVRALLTLDKQFIISMCNGDGKIVVYERESGKLIQELDSGEKSTQKQFQFISYKSSISISNDMKVLVSTNYTKDIKVWTRK